MSEYSEFFLSTSSDVVQYEMLRIAHPSFSKDYRLTRNAPNEINAGGITWSYCPMMIETNGARSDLDFSIKITLGDVGIIVQSELEAIRAADGNLTYPTVHYSTFASNNLASPLVGPFELQVRTFALTRAGAAFECVPQVLNRNRTGVFYTPAMFPSLRGFL